MTGLPQTEWEHLPRAEQDYFTNPHYFQEPTAGVKTAMPEGMRYQDRAVEVIGRLTQAGAQKALEELDEAIKTLDKFERLYPHTEVDAIRAALRQRVGVE